MKILKNLSIYVTTTFLIFGGVVLADKLTPSNNTSTTNFVTLQDIYNRLQTSSNYYDNTPESHTISTSNTPAEPGTMYTLSDIWTSLNNLNLPTQDKVQSGYQYGPNNSITGTLSSGTSVLEWSTSQGSMTWDAAVAYCASIGGELPTIEELLAALTAQFTDLSPFMSGFAEYTYYWSSTENGSDYAYVGDGEGGYVYNGNGGKSDGASVRCVR